MRKLQFQRNSLQKTQSLEDKSISFTIPQVVIFFMMLKAALMLKEYRRNYGAITQRSNKEPLEICHQSASFLFSSPVVNWGFFWLSGEGTQLAVSSKAVHTQGSQTETQPLNQLMNFELQKISSFLDPAPDLLVPQA